jgi:tRNA dimethylallyltransferase
MSVERKPIVILGPTASGKSDSAMSAALNNGNTEIVVCDAMQVYKRMDIGTAKPTLEDQQKVKHHCIDLVEPSARFTVSDYQIAARAAVADIHSRDKNALVVAGTGLYLTSLIDDLSFPGEWPEIRRELQEEPDVNTLYRRLKALDPVAAANIERSNRRRIERALEVCMGSGKPFSDNAPGTGAYPDNGVVQIGLLWPRDVLVKRVAERVNAMLKWGFLDEVRDLRKSGNMSITAKQAFGYAELLRHLEGKCTLEQAVGDIVIHTRQFAVRQERWFRRDPRITWVNIEKNPVAEIGAVLAKHLN